MIVAPNSPRPRANASAAPATSPVRASGTTTRKNVRVGPAPRVHEPPRREGGEDSDHREDKEPEPDEARPEDECAADHRFARKPAARSLPCAHGRSSLATYARAALMCGLDFTTATAY